jgi:hypothetical protein
MRVSESRNPGICYSIDSLCDGKGLKNKEFSISSAVKVKKEGKWRT